MLWSGGISPSSLLRRNLGRRCKGCDRDSDRFNRLFLFVLFLLFLTNTAEFAKEDGEFTAWCGICLREVACTSHRVGILDSYPVGTTKEDKEPCVEKGDADKNGSPEVSTVRWMCSPWDELNELRVQSCVRAIVADPSG
jgi:hypothetical protein